MLAIAMEYIEMDKVSGFQEKTKITKMKYKNKDKSQEEK
jgi:hypothetical protein